ncbi:MAG: preprotein translocase subunit YajC [Vicinamibacteria bacterium]
MLTAWIVPLQGSPSFFGSQLLLMVVIFGVFYIIVVRPMRKKQHAVETMLGELKNGDRVLTSGGIFGTIVGVSDDSIQLRVADHVKIQVAKSAVTQLLEDGSKRS